MLTKESVYHTSCMVGLIFTNPNKTQNHESYKWRPQNLSELTPMGSNTGLTHLG